jgi:MFS family permease
MRQSRRVNSETAEDRWAEVQSLLDRTPTESAEERLRRWRRLRLSFVIGLSAAGLVLALVVVLLVGHGTADEAEPPVWQQVAGLGVEVLALVVIVAGLVLQLKGNRRLRVWSNPMAALTRQQRRQLIVDVRGGGAVDPARLPLARYMAELLVHQRTALTGQVGLVVLCAGQWIVSPTTWRLTMTAVMFVIWSASMFFLRRDVGRARAFLDRHPDPAGPSAR